VDGLVAHAGRVGLIAGALLLVIGINWVGALRGCPRAVWQKEEDRETRPCSSSAGVLVGLGVVGLVAMGSSVFANSAVCWTADKVRIEGGAGRALLFFAGLAIALLVDFLLLVYLLTQIRLAPDFSDAFPQPPGCQIPACSDPPRRRAGDYAGARTPRTPVDARPADHDATGADSRPDPSHLRGDPCRAPSLGARNSDLVTHSCDRTPRPRSHLAGYEARRLASGAR
jgi:hypothetical protein